MSLLEFQCRLRYPSQFQIDVAFQTRHRVTALFGPSGSGKTSILSILAGLRDADEGLVRLHGKVLFDSARQINLPPEKRELGYVFQDHLLFPHLNVRRNLLYGWKRKPSKLRQVQWAEVVDILELGALLEQMPHSLSGGQRQRVALGRALLASPRMLLLDEPLAFLDHRLRQRVIEFLQDIIQQWSIPVLLVSHETTEVESLANWVIRLREGRVESVGTPEEIFFPEKHIP